MKRIVWCIIFLALLVVSNGCKPLMNFSSSSLFSNFSLEELVRKNRSPSGMVCAQGAMGGGGGSISSVGPQRSSNNKTVSFSCQISNNAFDEVAFIASLKADVEQEIRSSGATIVSQGSAEPAGFYLEYNENEIRGRISIGGKKSGTNFYSLVARLDERSGAESK